MTQERSLPASPDALTAAPYAAARHFPLLLVGGCYAPPPTANFTNGRDVANVTVAGGPFAVCDTVVDRLR